MINRLNYNLREAFPPISNFPSCENTNSKIAVICRLFLPQDQVKWRNWLNLALWSTRSHILNSDMRDHNAKFFFHVSASHFEYSKEVFKESGVQRDSILVYPDNLVKAAPGFPLSYAAAPLLDTRLDKFEYIVVMDADMFSLRSKSLAPFPLISTSIDNFPPDEIGLERSWTSYNKEHLISWYDNTWIAQSPYDKIGWIRRVAEYCSITPEALEDYMYSGYWGNWRGYVGHCGAYIRIPVSMYKRYPEFRSFMREVSGDLGNEEMALGVWYIRHFLETGERFPSTDFPIECNKRNSPIFWDSVKCRDVFENDMPCQLHLFNYDNIADYIYELSEQFGASNSERDELSETVITGVEKIKDHDK